MSKSTPEERLSHISARLSDIAAIIIELQQEIEDIYISIGEDYPVAEQEVVQKNGA